MKKAITKVLSCFVVIVFLMSSFSVAVIAADSSNSTASNVSDLPVLNDTDISTAKTVSSLGYCSYVWIEITDKYCKGYEVYVDGVYQFTEGESGTPDGCCGFKVTPGYHTFKLTLNGKEVSKGWNCQCGTGYNWMSMNDMRPHWCEGGNDNNNQHEVKFRGEVTYDSNTLGAGTYIVTVDEVLYDPQDYFKWSGDAEVNWGIWKDGPYVENADVGDKVELFGRYTKYDDGIHVVDLETSSHYLKKIDSESLSISVWTDKSEYKIGETVTINYQTNRKCTAKLTITKPDGGDIVYGPNEIPASTRSKSATAGYPTGKRTVVFEAWAGAEYKKATCYFEVVEENKPDLIVSSINFNPNPANKDDDVIVSITVKDQGNGDAGPHYEFLGFPDRFTLLKEWYCSGLKVGASRTFTHTLENVQQSDTYEACADWGQVVQESNENNNCLTANLEVKKSEEKPDLVIQNITCSPSSPKQGDTVTFTVKIKNRGDGTAGTSTVKYYIDASYVDSDTVPSLSVGSTSTQTFTWTANKCGNVQVKAVADATNVVIESNEGNNQSTETVNVVCPKKQVHNINTGKDFSSIQAAINDSDTSPGNTITVDPGTYTENVDVTKSLTIKSTSGNPEDTIVQAAVSNQNYPNVFTVTSDNVHIDGFTIKGASYFWCSGILLDSNNCIISNNTFEGNAIGIWIHPPSLGNNVIRNNKFSSSSGYSPSTALYLEAANNKIYLNNFIIGIEGSDYPGNFWNSPSKTTYTYKGNTFTNYLGNYWEEYTDTDADSDGIWDHPLSIGEDKDNYPLVGWFENYVSVEEKPEIKFIGIFDHSLSMWNGNAQGYFFSIHAAPVRQVVTCGQACIVIPLNTPDKKLAAISLFLKTLKKGDMVSIYAELKSEGTFCDLGFTSDKYFVRRESAKLDKAYINFIDSADSFYVDMKNGPLEPVTWDINYKKNLQEIFNQIAGDTAESTVINIIILAVSTRCPEAGIIITALDTGLTAVTRDSLTNTIIEAFKISDIKETIKNSNTIVGVGIDALEANGDDIKDAYENSKDPVKLLKDRQDLLRLTYDAEIGLDNEIFNYLNQSGYLLKVDDYKEIQSFLSALSLQLDLDYVVTSAVLNTYEDTPVKHISEELNHDLRSHCMPIYPPFKDQMLHCFGYLNDKKDVDEYILSIPKEFTPNIEVAGDNLEVTLKQNGNVVTNQILTENRYCVLKKHASGIYTLKVSRASAGPYDLIVHRYKIGDDYYPSVEPIERIPV